METRAPASHGFLDSLKSLGAGLLGTVHDRIALLSAELQEEKLRLIEIFVWISAALFSAMLAITFASLTLVYFFWENARLSALGGLAIFYSIAVISIVLGFKRYLARQPRPFNDTLKELQEDRSCIQPEN